jgi:hypothetical protein
MQAFVVVDVGTLKRSGDAWEVLLVLVYSIEKRLGQHGRQLLRRKDVPGS